MAAGLLTAAKNKTKQDPAKIILNGRNSEAPNKSVDN